MGTAKLRKFGVLSLAPLGAALVPVAAMAQDSGFATAVTGTINSTKSDVTTIGIAVLAVIVLIAAIGWVARSIKK